MSFQIPPRSEFNVSEQVYEWLRSLQKKIEKQESEDNTDSINTLIGFLNEIESELDRARDEIDTTELINAKIEQLKETVDSLPDENDILQYLGLNKLTVKTYEYTGTFASPDLTTSVNITKILGQGECSVEVSSNQPLSSDALISSRLADSETIELKRGTASTSTQYVLKVRDNRNG